MANFMIRFLICNVFISGIIGILLIAKWVFRNNLSSRMQYNLWLLLLGLLAVPFMPFRLVSFPQIFSWLSSVQNSTTSHADVGTNNVMNTDLSGTTNYLVFAFLQAIQFVVGVYVLLSGVRLILGEIVPAFRGIAMKLVPNAIPALDCPVLFPYSPKSLPPLFFIKDSFIPKLLQKFI